LPTDYQFTGQRWEDGLGLYDYNVRYYDPLIGRFISADTIVPSPGDPQSLNRYSYVQNNPLKYTDPSGHVEMLDWDSSGWWTRGPMPQKPRSWVHFAGDWSDSDRANTITGARTVGGALARVLNGSREERLMLSKSGDPLASRITAREAFLRVFGMPTVKLTSESGFWCERMGCDVQCGAATKISARLFAHELGHVFNTRAASIPYTMLASTTIQDRKKHHVTGINEAGVFKRTNLGYRSAWFPDQQHPLDMDSMGNTPGEDFADMLLNWAFNTFSDDETGAGAARYEWMATNMAAWISAASR